MSTGSHRGPLPLLNVSEEGAWQWRQHRLVTSKAYEPMLGQPVRFEELTSVRDVFEGTAGVDRLKFQAAEGLLQVFTKLFCGEIDAHGAFALWPVCSDCGRGGGRWLPRATTIGRWRPTDRSRPHTCSATRRMRKRRSCCTALVDTWPGSLSAYVSGGLAGWCSGTTARQRTWQSVRSIGPG